MNQVLEAEKEKLVWWLTAVIFLKFWTAGGSCNLYCFCCTLKKHERLRLLSNLQVMQEPFNCFSTPLAARLFCGVSEYAFTKLWQRFLSARRKSASDARDEYSWPGCIHGSFYEVSLLSFFCWTQAFLRPRRKAWAPFGGVQGGKVGLFLTGLTGEIN